MEEIHVVTVSIQPEGVVLLEVFKNINDALEFEKMPNLIKHFEEVLMWPEVAEILKNGGDYTISYYRRDVCHGTYSDIDYYKDRMKLSLGITN